MLGTDDVFIIAERDKGTHSMIDDIHIVHYVPAPGDAVKILDCQWLELATLMSNRIIAFPSAAVARKLAYSDPLSEKKAGLTQRPTPLP